jgi:PAS domain S-box-containing protein
MPQLLLTLSLIASLLACFAAIAGRRAHRRMLTTHRELKSVFDITACATIITGADRLIIHANHAFENFMGRSRNEIENIVRLDECIDPDYLDSVRENHFRLRQYACSAPRRYRTRLCHKAGGTVDVQMTEGLIPGTDLCVTSMFDISAAMGSQSIFEKAAVGEVETESPAQASLNAILVAHDQLSVRALEADEISAVQSNR